MAATNGKPNPMLRAIMFLVCILLNVGRVPYMGPVIVWVGPCLENGRASSQSGSSAFPVTCTRAFGQPGLPLLTETSYIRWRQVLVVIDRRESHSLECGRCSSEELCALKHEKVQIRQQGMIELGSSIKCDVLSARASSL